MEEIDLDEIHLLDSQIEEVCGKTYEILKNHSIAISNIGKVTKIAMEVVEGYQNLSGAEKKKLVQECIKSLIDTYVTDDEEKKQLLKTSVDVIPELIETYIDISNGNLNVNKTIKLGTKMSKCIFKCCC